MVWNIFWGFLGGYQAAGPGSGDSPFVIDPDNGEFCIDEVAAVAGMVELLWIDTSYQ